MHRNINYYNPQKLKKSLQYVWILILFTDLEENYFSPKNPYIPS